MTSVNSIQPLRRLTVPKICAFWRRELTCNQRNAFDPVGSITINAGGTASSNRSTQMHHRPANDLQFLRPAERFPQAMLALHERTSTRDFAPWDYSSAPPCLQRVRKVYPEVRRSSTIRRVASIAYARSAPRISVVPVMDDHDLARGSVREQVPGHAGTSPFPEPGPVPTHPAPAHDRVPSPSCTEEHGFTPPPRVRAKMRTRRVAGRALDLSSASL